MDRRGFLKFAAGGTVGLVASPFIWNTLYDAVYWTQSWGWIPRLKKGSDEYLPAVSKLCPSGTGFLVRTVAGVPVRTIGDKNNPVSKGALTALAAAEAELRVSPSRIKTPLRRTSDGAYVSITWVEAEKILKEKAKAAGRSVCAVSGDPTSSINEVISATLRHLGSDDFYFMPDDESPAAAAWAAMGGQGRIGYDVENSDCILAVGAPVLESWGVVASNRAVFNRTHPAGGEASLKLIYASPIQNNTAAGADLWLPMKPGTDITLLLGLANLLIKAGKAGFAAGLQNFAQLCAGYTPDKVAGITGVPAARLEAAAKALCEASRPLVIAGSMMGSGGQTGPVMAAIALNMLLGNIGQKGGLSELPYPAPVVKGAAAYREIIARQFVDYTLSVKEGKREAPGLLIFHAANPAYALPEGSGIKETLQKAGYVVSVASFMSETCAVSDLVLPAALGMEAFDDVLTPYGSGRVTYALARPVARPFAQARPAGELFIALAQELGVSLGVKDMPGLLFRRAYALGLNFKSMLEDGRACVAESLPTSASPLFYNWEAMQRAASAATADGDYMLAPVVVLGLGTPQTSVPPFAAKTVTDYQISGKYSVAQMNSATAAKLKVSDGDKIKITAAGAGSCLAVVSLFEGVMPDTLSLVAGLGHTAFDKFSRGKGASVASLACISREPGTGLPVWGVIGIKAAKA